MIMSTISENLQTIKNSTDAIKQAIIDKGGEISGDITTWADVISGLSGGGTDEEYVFTGTPSHTESTVTITGILNKAPDTGRNFLLALSWWVSLCYDVSYVSTENSCTLTIDFGEPSIGNEIPALCILNIVGSTHTIIPVKFIQQN